MPSFLGRQRFQTSAIAVIFSGEASDIPRNPFPQEVKYGIQKFCQRTRHIFAEVLCLFLAVTLSAVGGGLFRLISCICTIAVLVCVCVNYALNRAKEDQHRKLPNTIGRQLFYSVAAALPFLVLGLTLCLAKAGRNTGIGGTSCWMRRFCSSATFAAWM